MVVAALRKDVSDWNLDAGSTACFLLLPIAHILPTDKYKQYKPNKNNKEENCHNVCSNLLVCQKIIKTDKKLMRTGWNNRELPKR